MSASQEIEKDQSLISNQQPLLSPIPESKRVKDDEESHGTETKVRNSADVFDRLGGAGAK
jgi:hypothetical protein